MQNSAETRPAPSSLAGHLTTPRLVFLVVAAAAPMAAMIGTGPLMFAIGDGAATPAMFSFAGVVLLCFSVGYAAMSRHVVNAGGFYTYIGRGLGKVPAVGAALIAVLSYNAITIALAAGFGYFANIALQQDFSINVPWLACTAVGWLVVAWLGYRQVDNRRLLDRQGQSVSHRRHVDAWSRHDRDRRPASERVLRGDRFLPAP